MMHSKAESVDFCSGPLFGKILFFTLPIMLMNILQLTFNATDMIIVGHYSGKTALAAVGATAPLINLIVNLFMGLSVGTSVIVAQDYGAHKVKSVQQAVHTSIAISAIAGMFVMVLGLTLCGPLLRMMGTPDDILAMSIQYMRIYFFSIPASMIFNFGAAILRSVGDSRRPMYFLIVSGVLHVFLNLYLVVVLKMSVAGVAWSTVLSQYVAMALILMSLSRSEEIIRLVPGEIRIDAQKMKQIVRVGLPAGLQSFLFSISNVLIQSAVNSFGSTVIAASSAAGNVENFVGTTINAYYNSAITFTGQNMGAKKPERIDTVAKVITILVIATWVVLGGAAVIFSKTLLSFYTTDPSVLELGMLRMKIMMAAYVSCGIMNVFPGLTRSMGYSVLPMISTLIGACLLRIAWVYTFFAWNPTIIMLFICYPITWTIAGIGQVGSFFYARRQVNKATRMESTSLVI